MPSAKPKTNGLKHILQTRHQKNLEASNPALKGTSSSYQGRSLLGGKAQILRKKPSFVTEPTSQDTASGSHALQPNLVIQQMVGPKRSGGSAQGPDQSQNGKSQTPYCSQSLSGAKSAAKVQTQPQLSASLTHKAQAKKRTRNLCRVSESGAERASLTSENLSGAKSVENADLVRTR